ncbi:helix-turn-helix transcriptional regulator [Jannaschia aquimarina]|uniref:Autoinducer binding domain protein n=2 Tax=Jannaschia aquimarina TaxID=935700 RepID=A0A0D1EBW0_9RHOB|nr:autoinducer binding domain-containing protein [Jannaschia aquimarina]KIT14346.1 Autoinducer binding domain protein [Jannaschia aquimarina]SNS86649.1 LuxR family transcriptional regulator [Jannaschia aquimarina]
MVRNLQELERMAPNGYSVGLNIRFASPMYFKSTYPQAWQNTYAHNNYALRDPLVFWGISQTGATRWSKINLPDPFGVLKQAHDHGLTYGAVASVGKITSRSIVGIARDDREFTDGEIEELEDLTRRLHDSAEPPEELTPAMVEALVLIGQGYRHASAARELGISESALKARLSSARERLGAQTTAEALRMAREYRLI